MTRVKDESPHKRIKRLRKALGEAQKLAETVAADAAASATAQRLVGMLEAEIRDLERKVAN